MKKCSVRWSMPNDTDGAFSVYDNLLLGVFRSRIEPHHTFIPRLLARPAAERGCVVALRELNGNATFEKPKSLEVCADTEFARCGKHRAELA
jgi:hypothetical protein